MTITPKLQMLDLSHHNWPVDWDRLKDNRDLIGIIWKATEGTSFVDGHYHEAREQVAKLGLLWGAYHFATNSEVEEQVEHFLNNAEPDHDMRLVLDWEDYGDKQMTDDQAALFLAMCDAWSDRVITLYSGNTAKEALGDRELAWFGAHPLWIPRYSSSVQNQPVPQKSWDRWDIWQYAADGEGLPPSTAAGVNGYPDCNVFADDIETVRRHWSGRITPRPDREVAAPSAGIVKITVEHSAGVEVIINEREV